ncbi:Rab proteins geranylgeranyltransferase component like protein [Argiope bruennichi]|uniref:Rab proteins geranylgeranyltransferase component A n=1 Tax=Argiope bruennichi TaxID=94029 RepID=A0A8T0FXB3_ARGBR|nr:Rab proteins geranylgeranyltransferase component like protein [Argiope bruennichi]
MQNGYYGGDWASFSYDKFLEWINEVQSPNQPCQTPLDLIATLASFLREEETLHTCPLRSRTITNLVFKSFVNDSPDPPSTSEGASSGDSQLDHASKCETRNEEGTVSPAKSDSTEKSVEQVGESNGSDSNDACPEPDQDVLLQHEWTTSEFMENRRKFNIDLAPKIMFSKGSLVELLISSNIARYSEFQCVTRVLTYINGQIQQVPCSRADVFSTKTVSVVEKRMLMKFLSFCLKFESETAEFQGYEDKPFIEFLRSKKLTSNVEHHVIHAIAMVDETCSTLKGLQATQKFLQSLGKYGKTPFICTCYGSAELPQCFCRLCAVYEGMYYLKRKVDGVLFDKDNKCCGIVTMGQRIGCEWLVMESSYAPIELIPQVLPQRISRAILITDASLHPSENKENTLLRIPPQTGVKSPITVLEFGSKNYVCPEDLYLVYMICRSSNATAEEDLKSTVELLFSNGNKDTSEDEQEEKPNVLCSVYFNQWDTSTVNLNEDLPSGFFLTSSPDLELDYEYAVKEAHDIFTAICPDEEFLPRAPDPEDILIEMHNNPGDEGEGGNIENDVNNLEDDANAHDEQNAINDEVKEQNAQEPPEMRSEENK